MKNESLQEKYSPNGVCFGCGPSNTEGLHIKSYPEGNDDILVADFTPRPYHTGYTGFTNGGIISMLADCHGNMTAAYALMKAQVLSAPPGTVTAEYTVKFLKPSPINATLHARAWPTKIEGNRVAIEGDILINGVKTVSMRGTFVAVKEAHPAFDKWS